MYELKRKEKIQDDLMLGDELLHIELDVAAIARDYRRCQVEILKAEEQMKTITASGVTAENMDQALACVGSAVMSLFELVFGRENAARIVAYYDDNFIEMIEEVIPYINTVVAPQIQNEVARQKERLQEQYNPTRGLRKKAGM